MTWLIYIAIVAIIILVFLFVKKEYKYYFGKGISGQTISPDTSYLNQ